MARTTFTCYGTDEGTTEWGVFVDGTEVGEMIREPQRKMSVSHGWIIDRAAPKLWTISIDGTEINVADGASAA